eukprot:180305-Rhodomonas_salina.1
MGLKRSEWGPRMESNCVPGYRGRIAVPWSIFLVPGNVHKFCPNCINFGKCCYEATEKTVQIIPIT